jgi:hypothetical protein
LGIVRLIQAIMSDKVVTSAALTEVSAAERFRCGFEWGSLVPDSDIRLQPLTILTSLSSRSVVEMTNASTAMSRQQPQTAMHRTPPANRAHDDAGVEDNGYYLARTFLINPPDVAFRFRALVGSRKQRLNSSISRGEASTSSRRNPSPTTTVLCV